MEKIQVEQETSVFTYSGSWKQDRFYFSDANKQTYGTLRFYMQGGVNNGYANRADMYARYHEYGYPLGLSSQCNKCLYAT